MTDTNAVKGFWCESKLVSDIMLRVCLAIGQKKADEVDSLIAKFWADEEEARAVSALIANARAEHGSKMHAATFAVFLQILSKEYLRYLGYEGRELESNLQFITSIVPVLDLTAGWGVPHAKGHSKGPTRGDF